MAKKLRVRKHKVVLNRSAGGDLGITVMLIVLGVLMFVPMYYAVMQSFKPLDELWLFPPKFYVVSPTGKNYSDLFYLMNSSWVPFSRYVFNTVLITGCGTFGNLALGSLAAYAIAKIPFPGRNGMFKVIVLSLMFVSTVTAIANFIIISWLGWVDNLLSIIVPACASTLGLYLMKQFMESSVSDAVLESARLDGAGEFKVFWTIAMPMVKPAWLTLIVTSFQTLWNTGSSIYIQSEQFKTFNYAITQIISAGIVRAGAGTAAMVIMMVVPVTVFIITQANIIETMGASGMKD